MTLKKIKITDVFLVFALCFLFHFAYVKLPNFIFSLFFPVNESIWEHMKLFFTPYLLSTIIDYIILRKYKVLHNNLLLQMPLIIIFSIFFYLLIYTVVSLIIKDSMIINISLMFITIAFAEYLSYKLLYTKRNYKILNKLSLLLTFIIFLVFSYFTYKPLHEKLFYDETNNKYGIDIYL